MRQNQLAEIDAQPISAHDQVLCARERRYIRSVVGRIIVGEKRVVVLGSTHSLHRSIAEGTFSANGVRSSIEEWRGRAEVELAHRASRRLLELLNQNAFTVATHGDDRYGRTLATIKIAGRDVGDILIDEGLARRWPDGPEFWC
ncbi:thermonuclease family protein [Devosia sp. XJ19-45]|uniref:Thermonuclease family protein n=1 Tax=Devosia ureilytica TaxID=2952754 RepID=A0A9Q4ATC3_9HYPH|nr:thermonuclease family protein [Devosia ureilytica]